MRSIIYTALLILFSVSAHCGSLFSDSNYKSLIGDHKSRNVGESVTVLIYERASAATSAGTETDKTMGFGGSARLNDHRNDANVGISSDFSGGGTISRSGKLVASVTVTIDEILSSGEMLVSGEQLIEFNNEKQHIKLSGRIRPEDISSENSILSTRLADAKITYVGDGLLGSRQKPGWLTRLFNLIF